MSLPPLDKSMNSSHEMTSDKTELFSLRRIVQIEILSLIDLIDKNRLTDPLSKGLLKWCKEFRNSMNLRSLNEEKVVHQFIELLQEHLVDPVSQEPLTDFAILGIDGWTYNPATRLQFIKTVSGSAKYTTPLDDGFQHPLIEKALATLQILNTLVDNHLPPKFQLNAPPKPLKAKALESEANLTNLMLEILQIQEGRDAEKKLEEQKMVQELDLFEEEMLRNFQQYDLQREERALQGYERDLKAINALRLRGKEQSEKVREAIHELSDDISCLEIENAHLSEKLQDVNGKISSIERAEIQLKQSVNEAKIAIKKSKKSWFSDISGAVLIPLGCAFATWALSAALSSMGSTVTGAIVPVPNGLRVISLRTNLVFN